MKGKLSAVFPAFNEVGNIETLVRFADDYLPTIFEDHEIIVVDDGSTDGTGPLIDGLAAELGSVVAVHHAGNLGYGASLRSGFTAATGDYIFFTDGDGQFDLRQLPRLTQLAAAGFDIACGYRTRRADPLIRLVNARLYNIIIRIVFGLTVKDIDCAFKLFRREILENVTLTSEGAFINAEFLILAMRDGWRVGQVGVDHLPRQRGTQTGNNPMVVAKAFRELASFWRGLRAQKRAAG
jgi:glycosyltransferase involved in cell wall biosynthesis